MKKVLIIAYYWPPAGGPGVQRWLKFVKYLPEFGVDPVLYLPKNPHYPIQDASLGEEIPETLTIYRHPIREPYGMAGWFSKKAVGKISSGIIPVHRPSFLERTMLWIRGNLFVPDARKFWVRPSIRVLKGILDREGIDTVITTGPPHSLHLIGMGLARDRKIRWIADFRDSWTTIGYHKKLRLGSRAETKHKALEKLVLSEADHLIVTSPKTREEFEALTRTPITVITNGYDDIPAAAPLRGKGFTLAHIGSLLSGRCPDALWQALAELVAEYPEFRKAFELQLIGTVSDDVLQRIHSYGLEPYTRVLGYMGHKGALAFQREAEVLLLLEIDSPDTRGIIPGKLFEYMAAERPILAVGPSSWDAGAIVEETSTGKVFGYHDRIPIKKLLLEWFIAYREGALELKGNQIENYHRKALTGALAKLL